MATRTKPAPAAVTAPVAPAVLLSAPDAASRLGVSQSTLRRLTRAGTLASVKVRGCRRWSNRVLDEYVERLENEAARRGW